LKADFTPIGPWPPAPPFPKDQTLSLWLDGSLAGATAAAWLDLHRRSWIALVPAGKTRALETARVRADERTCFALPHGANPLEPASLTEAARVAAAHDAPVLVLPISARLSAPTARPLPLRLFALEEALREWELGPLWAPLLHHTWRDLGRLTRALGVPREASWDCSQAVACGECPGCIGRRRALGAEPESQAGPS
jgi:hypothetical protein